MASNAQSMTNSAPMDAGQSRLIIKDVRGDLDIFLEKSKWTFDEVLRVLSQYWYDDAEIYATLENIQGRVEEGEDDYINSPGFRQQFKIDTWMQFRRLLYSDLMDPLTRLGAMSPFAKTPSATMYFEELAPRFFLRNFYDWGFGVITGNPNSGKTHFATIMMHMAGQEGFNVATNIDVVNPPAYMCYTTSFKELLLFCVNNCIEGRKTIIFLDEMPQFFNKKRTMSGEYLTFEKVLFLLRKVGGNMIGLVQSPRDVPKVMGEFSESYYQKINQKTLLFQRDRGNGSTEIHIIGNVPQTPLKYETKDWATFEVDLDIGKLQTYVAHIERGSNQLEAIRDYIMYVMEDEGDNKIRKQLTCISYLKEIGYTQVEIGQILDMEQGTVSRKLKQAREMKV